MRIPLILALYCSTTLTFAQAKRGLSLIEKNKFDQAYSALTKALRKDSVAPAEEYVLSVLFMDHASSYYAVDSAYDHIIKALDKLTWLEESDPKTLTKLQREGFTRVRLATHKRKVDSVAFQITRTKHTEKDYNNFIRTHSTALEMDSAIALRNSLAFQKASETNTYSSYQSFFNRYPNAVEVAKAKKRYERLLYRAKTSTGKEKDFADFVENYPHSPFLQDALDQLYAIQTSPNRLQDYQKFIRTYPQSQMTRKAVDMIYYLAKDKIPVDQILALYQDQAVSDSLQQEIQLNRTPFLVTMAKEFEFIDTTGQRVLGPFSWISSQTRCRGAFQDVFLVADKNARELLSRGGHVIFKGEISSFEDEGNGFIKLTGKNGVRIIHKSGELMNKVRYTDAHMAGPYIAFRQREKWGLSSITGLPIIRPKYDSIGWAFGVLIFKIKRRYGLVPDDLMTPAIYGDRVRISLPYNGVTALDSTFLVYNGKAQGLLDQHLNTVVPVEKQMIEAIPGGIFVDREDSIFQSTLSNRWYRDINRNDQWTIGETIVGNDVFYNGMFFQKLKNASLLGNWGLLNHQDDSVNLYFSDSVSQTFEIGTKFVPVPMMGNASISENVLVEYKDEKQLYDREGKRIDVPEFDHIYSLGKDYLLTKKKDYFDLLDTRDSLLLSKIDGATSIGNGYVSILKGGQFGLLNSQDSIHIDPHYDRPILQLTDSYFRASTEGRYGMITSKDSVVLPFIYDDIQSLDGPYLIAKIDLKWNILDMSSGVVVLDNILAYQYPIPKDHTLIKISRSTGIGIFSIKRGVVLAPTYNKITLLTKGSPLLYLAVKMVEEADLVVLLYYNENGALFHKQVLDTAAYEKLICKSED